MHDDDDGYERAQLEKFDRLKEEGLLRRPMRIPLRIDTIQLSLERRLTLLALGCKLESYRWGEKSDQGLVKTNPLKVWKITFPDGSVNLKSPEERKRPKRKKGEPLRNEHVPHIDPKGWIRVPTELYPSDGPFAAGVIVIWSPSEKNFSFEKPGRIRAVVRAMKQLKMPWYKPSNVDVARKLQYKPSIGEMIDQFEGEPE